MSHRPIPRLLATPDPIRWWGRVAPSCIALVDRARDQRFTYAELDALADAWRDALRRAGVGAGERVATLASNRAAQPALFFACARLGAVLVPLNWRLSARELMRVMENARPAVVVGEGRFRGLAEEAAGREALRWIELAPLSDAPPREAAGASSASSPSAEHSGDVSLDAESPALILYTSGSTGTPKGALVSHRQLLYNAIATTTAWELGADDVAPISTPFFHTGGWNVFATPLWQRGGRVVLLDAFDAAAYLDALAEEGCTVAFTVPTQLVLLLESAAWGRAIPTLRFFISGGAPCPLRLIERVRSAGFGMKEGFGLTECGPNCFAMPSDEAPRRPGSVGWPVPFLETRLIDTSGRDVAADEVGELLLRGPQLFSGYFDDPVRTAEAVDKDGWLHTGDLAMRSADGAYRICGRRKEMFISGGENVYPGEVESALIEHPAVAQVAVIGVPDAKWGEVGCAFVVARSGAVIDGDALQRWARGALAGYKVPRHVTVVDALPTLGSGKVDRGALLERHRAEAGA